MPASNRPSYNPRIHVKKDNSRAVTAAKVQTRPDKLGQIAVMPVADKGRRSKRVKDTHLGIHPAGAWQPSSSAPSQR